MMVWKLLFVLLALGVAVDARRRSVPSWPLWTAAAIVAAPFVVPAYLCTRPLRSGERRVGGRIWCVCTRFAALWTIGLAIGAVELWLRTRTDPPLAFSRAVEVLGRGGLWLTYAAIWLLPALGASIVGLVARRTSIVETSPTATG